MCRRRSATPSSWFHGLVNARSENSRLKSENARLRHQLVLDQTALYQNVQLQNQLHYLGPPSIAAFRRVNTEVLTNPQSPIDQSVHGCRRIERRACGRRRGHRREPRRRRRPRRHGDPRVVGRRARHSAHRQLEPRLGVGRHLAECDRHRLERRQRRRPHLRPRVEDEACEHRRHDRHLGHDRQGRPAVAVPEGNRDRHRLVPVRERRKRLPDDPGRSRSSTSRRCAR